MSEIVLTDNGFQTLEDKDPDIPEWDEVKVKKLSPFDFINAINYTNDNLFGFDSLGDREDRTDSEYPKFLINRAESYFSDTILFANAANQYLQNVPNYSHFDFYRFAVSKKRRFAKWAKPIKGEDIDLVCKHFNYSSQKAIEVLNIISKQQLQQLRDLYDQGGQKK